MKKTTLTKATTALLVLIFATFFVAQWMPYFPTAEGEKISLARYLWFPTEHTDVTALLAERVPGYDINQILLHGIFLPVCALALLVLVLRLPGNPFVLGASGIWGLWGLLGYLTNPALRLGGGAKALYCILFIAAAVSAVMALAAYFQQARGEQAVKSAPQALSAQ